MCLFRLPVPNMIADLDQAPKERVDKPVWRVAFFGRLEERKGIKLFVDAVQVGAVLQRVSNFYQGIMRKNVAAASDISWAFKSPLGTLRDWC